MKPIIKWKKLTTISDLEVYAEITDIEVGVRFPIEYLQQGKVYGLYVAGRLRGGFALITKGPFRTVQGIPHELRAMSEEMIDENKTFEITGVWLDRDLKLGALRSSFWLYAYLKMTQTRRPYFLYAFETAKPGLGRLYSISNPVRLYAGPTIQLEGMPKPEDEIIEMGSMKALHKTWTSDPAYLIKKALKRSGKSKKEDYVETESAISF